MKSSSLDRFVPQAESSSKLLTGCYVSTGFSLLGCPIGPPSFFEEVLQGRLTKLKESLVLLHEVCDSHLVATLLRSCFALPMSFAPVIPPTSAKPVGMSTVPSERLWSPSWTDWSWLKASLPSSRGGFQPAECLAPCPCHFPVVFLALPEAGGENAGT